MKWWNMSYFYAFILYENSKIASSYANKLHIFNTIYEKLYMIKDKWTEKENKYIKYSILKVCLANTSFVLNTKKAHIIINVSLP